MKYTLRTKSRLSDSQVRAIKSILQDEMSHEGKMMIMNALNKSKELLKLLRGFDKTNFTRLNTSLKHCLNMVEKNGYINYKERRMKVASLSKSLANELSQISHSHVDDFGKVYHPLVELVGILSDIYNAAQRPTFEEVVKG